ncbi:MAG TPA: universal stress protein [Glaciihabitans sp.]|nr:universal stress protein [Glaciihabitans sp.]
MSNPQAAAPIVPRPVPTTSVVAWDGSDASEAALEWAITRAELLNGAVVLVRVVDDADLYIEKSLDESLTDAGGTAMEALVLRANQLRPEHPSVTFTTKLSFGHVVDELRKVAQPDTILVVGTGVPSTRHRRFDWSVSARLASTSRGPVAVVPIAAPEGRHGVVVGINGSDESIAAAFLGAQEAAARKEDLHLVLAWSEPRVGDARSASGEFTQWLHDSNQAMLSESGKVIADAFPELHVHGHLEHTDAAAAIHQHAANASLVVVGSRGRGSIRRLLLSSVSHSLLMGIECPTIVLGHAVLREQAHASDSAPPVSR